MFTHTRADLCVTQKQVWYWWKRRSASVWQRDSDPFVSLSTALGDSMLAGEVGQEQAATIMNEYCASRRSPSNTSLPGSASTPPIPTTDVRAKTIWKEGKPRAFAMYAIGIIASLGARTIEISLDATYGTNSSGHDLFAVLAELDGTGVPLLYLFMDTKDMLGDGRRIEILVEALRILKGMGLSPQFVGCDKDQAEINAIQTVWPNSKVQLCYWHVRRALRQRFSNSKATSTSTYHPFEAAATVSGLEPCWGVSSQRRHSDNPSICKCSCRSETSWDKPGRLEIPKDQNEMMINFVSRHFNLHPLFPNLAGTTLTSEPIRIQAATETYLFCRQRGWARLWAYLWTNWYNPDDWKLWARSSHPTIPVLKTTMICESHWRLIKHDYLHRFSRPRIDHVIHILRTRVLPQIVMRITSLLTGNLRMAMPSWRKEFVKLWRKSEGREVSPESLTRYRTSPDLWVCGCEAFLGSRFLICKHLISMVQPMSTSNLKRIQRHREPPLWTHPALIPTSAAVQAGNVQSVESSAVGDAEGRDEEDNADVRFEEAAEWAADDDEENELVPVSTQFDEAVELLTRLQNLVVREKPWLSRAFIEAFMRGNRQNIKLLEEDEQRLRRQTMPNTWTPGQHGATMYLRGSGSA
ncbi:hypothetical protein A4X13_0g8421 [Tilletia indica]|uniref:Uncharacterized protein n=1 Tax=Tilletia indica TaxID=43049 RepID=A0A177T330_9BASI|nr:hypothetical protein A4X13_0g8421 [Tilletia indica]